MTMQNLMRNLKSYLTLYNNVHSLLLSLTIEIEAKKYTKRNILHHM